MCQSKRQREKNDFKVFKICSFKDNISDFSCNRGKSYVCGDAQGQDDSGRSSHSESMVSETTYSVGHEYKVLKSSKCTVRDCETFVVERVEPYRVNVTVNGEIVNFIVDTGSKLTLLPEKVFTQLRIKSTMTVNKALFKSQINYTIGCLTRLVEFCKATLTPWFRVPWRPATKNSKCTKFIVTCRLRPLQI